LEPYLPSVTKAGQGVNGVPVSGSLSHYDGASPKLACSLLRSGITYDERCAEREYGESDHP